MRPKPLFVEAFSSCIVGHYNVVVYGDYLAFGVRHRWREAPVSGTLGGNFSAGLLRAFM